MLTQGSLKQTIPRYSNEDMCHGKFPFVLP